MGCAKIFGALRRCKQLENGDNSTLLDRCLGLLDLTALGVGSTLGLGVYVLAGAVAKTVAGPAVTLSFLVAAIASAFAVLLSIGVRESTKLNNVFTALNLATVVIVVIAGAIKSDPANWHIKVEDIPEEYRSQAGEGGFMPWGVAGVMAGAAKCFFGFVGFDCVATTGEEAKNPKRDIPISIVLSLIIIFVSYFSIATVLTMMWPYYLQDADAPFPHVFTEAGMPIIKWIVTIGAIFALCTSLLGAMFPLPRVLYAMGTDGVLFKPLATINAKSQTPILATILSGIFAAIMAAIFNLNQLIDMMSIGTLLAYTIVATSVLILRYEEENQLNINGTKAVPENVYSIAKQTFNLLGLKHPTVLSANIAKCTICILFVAALITCSLLRWDSESSSLGVSVGIMGGALLVILLVLYRQPRGSVANLSFKVPLVPLVPFLSVCMNVYLMVQLDYQTWVRFIIWLAIGYAIYFLYGIRHSALREKEVVAFNTNGKINEKQVITKF
ncbi:unnamed protein product, partial [Brenthis ino]